MIVYNFSSKCSNICPQKKAHFIAKNVCTLLLNHEAMENSGTGHREKVDFRSVTHSATIRMVSHPHHLFSQVLGPFQIKTRLTLAQTSLQDQLNSYLIKPMRNQSHRIWGLVYSEI